MKGSTMSTRGTEVDENQRKDTAITTDGAGGGSPTAQKVSSKAACSRSAE